MHIHANFMSRATGQYDPSTFRAEQAERAAQTRRKLQKAAQTISATDMETVETDASLLMGHWLTAGQNQPDGEGSYTPNARIGNNFPG